MNLMTQAVEKIYQNGNVTLHLSDKQNCKIMFYVGENGKLNIRMERDFGDNLIETFDLDTKEGLIHISLLVYYSFCAFARKKDLVCLTTDDNKFNSENSMIAINELYQQLMPLISADNNNIMYLARCDSPNQLSKTFMGLSKYVDGVHKILSIQDIMKSLIQKYEQFEKVAINAHTLWNNIKEAQTREEWYNSCCNWDNFFNQLYIDQFYDPSRSDLNSINIDYEFLTSKNYISDPAIDCEDEITNLEIALLTPSKSAMLVGPPGVGKTAIMEGLAYRISSGQVPPAFKNKRILKINTSSIVRGCSLVGMFQEKVEKIMQYLVENPDTILFIDEIHTAIGAGAGSNSNLDLANIMKPYLDRGQVKVVGATTEEEYEDYIKNDKAFNRRFQKITISEPKKNTVCKILKGTSTALEQKTSIKWDFDEDISDIIFNHIAECTNEINRVYDDKRYNPDISLTILEKAFAIALFNGLDSVSIENISDAIRRSEFLYESVRMISADKLIDKYHSSIQDKSVDDKECKILQFPTFKCY